MDDPRVLELVEAYIRRYTEIQKVSNLLDDPGRVGMARRVEDVIPPSVKQRLDGLCVDVTKILDAPMAAVTLINETQQIILGSCGMEQDDTGRDRSFCIFVAAAGLDFQLDDLAPDEVEQLPVWRERGIHAYLGMPVKVGGQTVGALCVVDYEARNWTALQRQLLQQYAGYVSAILEEHA